ncbi:hypothetical protein TNCT_125101 [Trichonephila clavata]|uniref:Uncharacterized protein n=1 Tax=Trichonephila clavata TaxID=2740835 RepID=A0A8X6M139_TRICU|nr:hypothetical protein TNCT_125101 [Trichonephila clavata]
MRKNSGVCRSSIPLPDYDASCELWGSFNWTMPHRDQHNEKKIWAAFLPKSGSQQEATSRNLLLENGISPNDRPDHAYPPKRFPSSKEIPASSYPPHPLTSLKTPDDELSRDFLLGLMEPPLRE